MKLISVLALLALKAAAVGAQNATAAGRIAYGFPAPKSSFPYVAYVNMGEKLCSGVVVGARWVLTAGHCGMGTTSASSVRVRVGSTNTRSGGKVFRVRQMVSPDSFTPTTLYGDLLMLELDAPTRVTPVRLPRGAASLLRLEDGYEVTVAGWGATQTLQFPERLYYTVVAYDGTGECAQGLQTGGPEDHICFASLVRDGRATCRGDSGGPFLWFTGEGAPLLVGITSYGPDVRCGDKANYDVATSAYYWADWISSIMAAATAERRNSKRSQAAAVSKPNPAAPVKNT